MNIPKSLKGYTNEILELYHRFNDLPINVDDLSWYRKHHKIDVFYTVYELYKTIPIKSRRDFQDYIFPNFLGINWTCVSGLYNPEDELFVSLFDYKINKDFAKKFNFRYKNLNI